MLEMDPTPGHDRLDEEQEEVVGEVSETGSTARNEDPTEPSRVDNDIEEVMEEVEIEHHGHPREEDGDEAASGHDEGLLFRLGSHWVVVGMTENYLCLPFGKTSSRCLGFRERRSCGLREFHY